MLLNLLRQIVLQRNRRKNNTERLTGDIDVELAPGQTVIDEVQEVIQLPQSKEKEAPMTAKELDAVEIPESVQKQLREYVSVGKSNV